MVLTVLRVRDAAVMYRESPFTIIFTVNMGMEESVVPCAMIGDAARVLINSIKKNDILTMDGEFMPGDKLGIDYPNVFAVERILLSEHAANGRNLNMYA